MRARTLEGKGSEKIRNQRVGMLDSAGVPGTREEGQDEC